MIPPPLARKVLLIGWDAADWQIIHPLVDAGLMPALAGLINRGVIGNLATLQPALSPILWNTIATGHYGDRHGILGFTEADESGSIRPVTSTSRRVKALWNILSQSGLKAHVLGWFASHPAEPLPGGAVVSDLFAHCVGDLGAPWPMPPGTVHPPRLAEILSALRVHPAELDEEILRAFVPRADEVDQKEDPRLGVLSKLLAECVSMHMAATYLLENEPWDFLAVYFDAIDHFCHAFIPFHPPAQAGIDEKQAALYGGVVRACYRFHDMMLETLLRLAGPDCTVLLLSDHGFYNDHQRPLEIPHHPSGPTISHRHYGVFALSGPGIRKDDRLHGASLLDVAPTVLSLFGLPAGADMPGRIWRETVQDPAWEPPPRIPTWEDVAGDAGLHPPEMRAPSDPEAQRAALQQLVALGYMEPLSADAEKTLRKLKLDHDANLAHIYLGSHRPELALPLLERVARDWVEQPGYILDLANCYFQLGHLERARALLTGLKDRPELAARADLLQGELAVASGDRPGALECLERAAKASENTRLPTLHLQIGELYLRQKEWARAESAFRQALVIDADCADAFLGLANVALRLRRNSEAAAFALQSIGLRYYSGLAHYALGVALGRLARYASAAQAFQVCLSIQPGVVGAHRWLAAIYRMSGSEWNDPVRAAEHQRWAGELAQRRRKRFNPAAPV